MSSYVTGKDTHSTRPRRKPGYVLDDYGVNRDLTLVCYALISCPSRLEIAGTVSTNIEYACITHGVIENEDGLSFLEGHRRLAMRLVILKMPCKEWEHRPRRGGSRA